MIEFKGLNDETQELLLKYLIYLDDKADELSLWFVYDVNLQELLKRLCKKENLQIIVCYKMILNKTIYFDSFEIKNKYLILHCKYMN